MCSFDNDPIFFVFAFHRCMKNLGERHPYFVSSLVPQIFITHPFYAIPEPNIDDPAHIAVSALVFNATVHSPPILSLLPPFAKQHYDYLRESLPEFIPALSKDDSSSSASSSKGKLCYRSSLSQPQTLCIDRHTVIHTTRIEESTKGRSKTLCNGHLNSLRLRFPFIPYVKRQQ